MKETKKNLKAIIMLLNIVRMSNCETGKVSDVFQKPLSILEIANGLGMKKSEFIELLEILENDDLIEVLRSKHREIIIIDEWINNLLQWYLTKDKELLEKLKTPTKHSNSIKYAFGLFLLVMCYYCFKNRIITTSNGIATNMAELGRKFQIDRADISTSFRILEKQALLKLEKAENSNSKNIIVSKLLVDELKHYDRKTLPKTPKKKAD